MSSPGSVKFVKRERKASIVALMCTVVPQIMALAIGSLSDPGTRGDDPVAEKDTPLSAARDAKRLLRPCSSVRGLCLPKFCISGELSVAGASGVDPNSCPPALLPAEAGWPAGDESGRFMGEDISDVWSADMRGAVARPPRCGLGEGASSSLVGSRTSLLDAAERREERRGEPSGDDIVGWSSA